MIHDQRTAPVATKRVSTLLILVLAAVALLIVSIPVAVLLLATEKSGFATTFAEIPIYGHVMPPLPASGTVRYYCYNDNRGGACFASTAMTPDQRARLERVVHAPFAPAGEYAAQLLAQSLRNWQLSEADYAVSGDDVVYAQVVASPDWAMKIWYDPSTRRLTIYGYRVPPP